MNDEWEVVKVGPMAQAAEEWETIAAGPPVSAPVQLNTPIIPRSTSLGKRLEAAGDTVAQALGPFADEAAAGLTALRPDVTYDQALSYYRPYFKRLQKEQPATSIAANIAGGVATAGLAPIKALQGASALGRIASALGMGAVAGGVAGFGEGEGGTSQRLKTAVPYAAAGSAFGGLLSSLGQAGRGVLSSGPVQRAISRMIEDQAGKIGGRGKPAPSPLALALLQMLQNTDPNDVAQASRKLAVDAAEGRPTFLAEGFTDGPYEELAQISKVYANKTGGRDGLAAINKRKAEQVTRLEEIFGSGGASKYKAGEEIQQTAQLALDAAEEARTKAVRPLYREAERSIGVIKDKKLDALIENSKAVQSAISEAKGAASLSQLPDTHFRVLDYAKKKLDSAIQDRRTVGGLRDSADKAYLANLKEEREMLKKLMDKNDPSGAYAKARARYGEISKSMPIYNDDVLPVLRNLERGEYDAAVEKVLKLPEERLTEVMTALGDDGASLQSVIKAKIQDSILSKTGNRDLLKTQLFSEKNRRKMDIIFGDDSTRVRQALEREDLYAKTADKLFMGSPTAPYLESLTQTEPMIARAVKAAQSPIKTGREWLTKLAVPPEDIDFTGRLTRALFDPAQAATALDEVVPLMLQRQTYLQGLDRASQVAGAATYSPMAGLASALMQGR